MQGLVDIILSFKGFVSDTFFEDQICILVLLPLELWIQGHYKPSLIQVTRANKPLEQVPGKGITKVKCSVKRLLTVSRHCSV